MNDKEIKIGEYIRDETGEIFRLIDKELEEETDEIYWYRGDGICTGCYSNQVVKHSQNIIDLIEVGDYVNGHKIVNIDTDPFISGQINLWTNLYEMDTNGDRWRTKYIDKDIKSIATKEQFKNIEYKVEE